MLPQEARVPAQAEFARLVSVHPNLPRPVADLEGPETDLSALKATVAAVVARRLAVSKVGKRLPLGLGRRLLNNALGRGAIAVLAPGGEICGPAVIICEAGLFAGVIGWESAQNRRNVVAAVDAMLIEQSDELRREV